MTPFRMSLAPLYLASLCSLPSFAQGVSVPVVVTNTGANPIPTSAVGTTNVAGSVGISPSANTVQIGNMPTVKVSGDDASRQPTQFAFRGTLVGDSCSAMFTVPTGQRLVIEHVAATMTTPTGQLLTLSLKTSADSFNIWLLGTKQGPFNASNDLHQVGQQLRAYSDAGSTVQACSQTPFSGVPGTTMSGDVVVAGYLVSL